MSLRQALELPDVGRVIREAMREQIEKDRFDVNCQACGGLGVVADYTNSWVEYAPWDPVGQRVYGSKLCGCQPRSIPVPWQQAEGQD